MPAKHSKGYGTLFHELNITVDDYSPMQNSPGNYSLPKEICVELHSIFLCKLKEAVELKDWVYTVDEGLPIIIISFDSTDIHPNELWEFAVDAGIPETITEEIRNSGIIPVYYHVSLQRSNKPWTELSDITKGGKGHYDPCTWASDLIDIIEKHCLTERVEH